MNIVEKYGGSSVATIEKIQAITGTGAEMAFQCTGSPKAASTIWKYVRRGGSMCELGFFVDNGDTTYNPHQDICNKEIPGRNCSIYQIIYFQIRTPTVYN